MLVKGNPKTKFQMWLEKVNETRKVYHQQNYGSTKYSPLTYRKGQKYIKIFDQDSIWGFVSMEEGYNMYSPVRIGDLLKPKNHRAPAKHSRGNIFAGTDKWEYHGPSYLR